MGYTKYLIATLLLLLALQQRPVAQVNITIGVTPPYSPYLSNYTSKDASKVFLTLQNTSRSTLQVRLAGSAVGDNGVALRSKPGFVSSQSITLAPLQVRQLNGSALSDIFDLNNFDVTGIDRNTLARTLRLPEGNYNLCVQALDYNTGQLLSGAAPLGCTVLTIAYPEPPVLVNPLPGDSIDASTPQNIIFNWMNPGSVPIGTEYTLEIQEMPARNANPNQVLIAATFPLLSQRVKVTSYMYNIGNLALKKDKYYAWRVVASDPSGRISFKNNGISAAGVFKYGKTSPFATVRSNPVATPQFALAKGNAVTVSGVIKYRFRASAGTLPASFPGLKAEEMPLKQESIQLCYGLCTVAMQIKKTQITQVVAKSVADKMKLKPDVQVVNMGKDSARITFYQIDSIPATGIPGGYSGMQPAGASVNGLGEVIATTTTDSSGSFEFKATTFKKCSIVEAYDGTALVYCYYINIKNKHYTDPVNYIYAPEDTAGSYVDAGFSKVFVDNYKLFVRINRDKEYTLNKGKQEGISVENKADDMVDIYILRKGKQMYNRYYIASGVPEVEGDNSGRIPFVSQESGSGRYINWGNFHVIAKRSVLTEKVNSGDYQATANFYNLVNNLDNEENYYVYAEYKGASVYFEKKEYGFQPSGNIAEYRPVLAQGTENKSMELKPTYVAIKIKGVLKYQFRNGAPAPLPNVSVSFQSILWTMPDLNTNQTGRQYDITNKYDKNHVFGTTVTDQNGYFELKSGLVNYNDYVVGNALFLGADQFITVNSPYYGSPDKAFSFIAGNTYNVGEQVALVKDYSFTPKISGKKGSNIVVLPGQRVYLCRKASVNPQLWGIPANEGVQKNLPQKLIHDADGVAYNVIEYGETGGDGTVKFENLVARDFANAEDQYYIYSESGITSIDNYSTQYGQLAVISGLKKASWGHYYQQQPFVFNKSVLSANYSYGYAFTAVALPPFIEGGVYPQSNMSTNAMPGVKVRMYNVTGCTQNQMEDTIAKYGVTGAIIIYGLQGKLAEQFKLTQTTGSDGIFRFSDPNEQGKYKAWKLLTFSKSGFVTNYEVINSGSPLIDGVKETVKGFLLPPQLVHTTVKDAETGKPIAANIVVGEEFSWASQKLLYSYNYQTQKSTTYTMGVDLTTPYGMVDFTVIPEDNVHYRTQTFSYKVNTPADPKKQVTTVSQTLPDFEMYSRKNRISVCLLDAKTSKGLAGTVTIMDIANEVNPAVQPVFLLKDHCKSFSFVSEKPSYRVQVSSAGYATKTVWVSNNSEADIEKDLLMQLEPAITVNGTVTQNGKAVSNAKVYVQELANLSEVYTDASGNYTLGGLPINGITVTITAVKTGLVGQSKTVKLSSEVSGSSGSSSGNSGGGGTSSNNAKQGGSVSANKNIGGSINTSKGITGVTNVANQAKSPLVVDNEKRLDFVLTGNDKLDLASFYGFPLEVEALDVQKGLMTGRVKVSGNTSFNTTANAEYLHFTRVALAASDGKGSGLLGEQGTGLKAAPETASGLVDIDDDDLPVTVFGKYSAKLGGFKSGIVIASYNKSAKKGMIKGTVKLNSDNVAGNVQWGGAVSLDGVSVFNSTRSDGSRSGIKAVADATASGFLYNTAVENVTPVFISHADLSGNIAASYTFLSKAGNLHYCLNNRYKTEATDKSTIAADGLHLFSQIHTQLEYVSKPDIRLNIGEVKVTNKEMTSIIGKDPISIPLDNWKITSKSWGIYSGVLELDGDIEAGAITVPAKGLEISETSIGFGELKLDKVEIAGVYKLAINQAQTLTAFGYDKAAQYGTLYDKKYGCWSLSLLPKNAEDVLTSLTSLPDLAYSDKLHIMNISLYSKGNESRVILKKNHPAVTLNSFASFTPFEIENGKDYLKVNGALALQIPGFTGTENAPYSLDYTDSAGKLVHKHTPIENLKLITNGIRTEFSAKTGDQVFTGNVLKLKGILRDKASSSPYALAVNFVKSGNITRMDVDAAAKDVISLGSGQQMEFITGKMELKNQKWDNFTFEGNIKAPGMEEDKPTHMGFEVKGDLVANKAAIGVKNMPFPGLSGSDFNLTYDFDKKAVVGSLQLNDMKTPAADFNAAVEMQLGAGEWYMLGTINVTKLKIVPLPLNGAGAAFCLGSTNLTSQKMQIIQPVFHNGILPNDFANKMTTVKGALFVAGVDVKLPLPNLDIDLGVANVHVGYGIYANAYARLTFDLDTPRVDGGLKVGAYVNVNGGASIGIACAGVSLSAEINAQGNLTLRLPSLKNSITYLNPYALMVASGIVLNVDMGTEFGGSAYVGGGVCNSSCHSVKVWGVTVPPGCHKESIGKSMSIHGGITIEKQKMEPSPSKAIFYLNLFGETYSTGVSIPQLIN